MPAHNRMLAGTAMLPEPRSTDASVLASQMPGMPRAAEVAKASA